MSNTVRIDVSDVKWIGEPFPEFVSPAASPIDPSSEKDWVAEAMEVESCTR